MRIAVCDDDGQELTHLSDLIGKYQEERGMKVSCRFFHNGTELLRDMKGGEYDLIFLDVLMPGVNGVQIAQELKELDKNVKLVFISSTPNYALASYSVGAYYYLLKPAGADSLFPLLDKVENELSRQNGQGFILKNRKGIVWVSFAELEYVEVLNKKVSFHLADGVIHETTAALSDFEEMILSQPEFMKIHRSYLVNLSHIQEIGLHLAQTKSGQRIPVSRQRYHPVKDAYLRFLQEQDVKRSAAEAQEKAAAGQAKARGGPWKILLVDDSASDRAFWADILKRHGCIVRQAENGEAALKIAAGEPCDCILLDVMIPGEDGFSVCEQMRKLLPVPVIFLSCITEPDRQVEGFAAGGADYITKDTPAELFWKKVETRIKMALSDRTQLCYGALLLDVTERRALIDGRELPLTSVEFDLLWRLSEQQEHVFTPEEIFQMMWEGQPWDGGKTVQMHMSRLRQKLERAWSGHHFIESVWGQGYRFVPETNEKV